jgi:diguanylate cyclase (GGDEF)-like protein
MQKMLKQASLIRYGAILTVLLSGIAALAIWAVFLTRQATEMDTGVMQKNAVATQIEHLSESMRLHVGAIAAHPQTLACFDAGNGEACRDQAANLYAFNREATLYFVQEGQNAGLLPGFLPDGTRRLIEHAARQNSAASAAAFTLTITQPVTNAQKQRVGFVVLEQGVPQLQALFDTLPFPAGGAYAELLQSQGAASSILMRRGNQSLKNGTPPTMIKLAGTPWEIAVWQNRPNSFQAVLPYLFGWVLLTLAFAVTVMAVLISMSNRVIDNLRVMAGMINDMRLNRLRAEYPVSLAEFIRPMKTMLKIAHLQLGRERKVTNAATFDHLSKVHNRRSFEEKQSELFKTLKDGWSHSLLLIDIDNFKQINDTFGHEAGDQMIIALGKALRQSLRSSDFIARLGGDEFCVLFPYTTLERAQELVERLRANMPEMVDLIPGVSQKLAWSGGLSEYSKDDEQENLALSRADAALLEAKRGGRNNTRVKAAA